MVNFYEKYKSEIDAIANANNVDLLVAEGMFIANATRGAQYGGYTPSEAEKAQVEAEVEANYNEWKSGK